MGKRAFYEPSEFPFLWPLRADWKAIREEVAASLDRAVVFPDPQSNLLTPGSRWFKYELNAWGLPVRKNLALLPRTAALLEQVPRVMQAAVYILGPQSHITPHVGYCDRVLRSHLGLRCPPGCALRVADEVRAEGDGVLLVFDDTNEHEAWNRHESEERLVLHIDFVRPELPAGDAWWKDLRLQIAREFPQMIPFCVDAGMDVDAEIREDFRAGRLPMPRREDSPAERWAAFEGWLAR
jgi:beta-hydroxylase